MQTDHEGHSDRKREDLGGVRAERAKVHAAIDQSDVGLAIVGFEKELGAIGQDQADPAGHENLHEMGAVAHRPDQQQVNQISKEKEEQPGRQEAQIWIDLEAIIKNIGGVHAHHQKSAMGKIDDAHDTKD